MLHAVKEVRARIHTGFHRFTEIGQIFHNRYIFSKNFKPSKLKSGKWFGESVNILSEWLRNPGKGTLGGKNPKYYPGEHSPRPP